MATKKRLLCPKTRVEIPPGSIFSWRSAEPVKVGEYFEDAGQLVWRYIGDASASAEYALAVLIGGQQARLRNVEDCRPPVLEVEYELPDSKMIGRATVDLTAALDAMAKNVEVVDGKVLD